MADSSIECVLGSTQHILWLVSTSGAAVHFMKLSAEEPQGTAALSGWCPSSYILSSVEVGLGSGETVGVNAAESGNLTRALLVP